MADKYNNNEERVPPSIIRPSGRSMEDRAEVPNVPYKEEVLSEAEQARIDEAWDDYNSYHDEYRHDDTDYSSIVRYQSEWEAPPLPFDKTRSIRNDVTVLGYDAETKQPVTIGDEESTSHLHVIGKTGKGKSTLLINRFVGDIQRGQGGAFITPDVGSIRRILERIPPHRMKDVVYLDPGDRAFPFGLNLLYCDDPFDQAAVEKGAERLLHVMRRIWGPGSKDPSWGPQLEDVLSNCIYALMYHHLTLADMSKLLKDKEFRQSLVSALPQTKIPWLYIREAWESFEELPLRLQEERTYSTYNKIMAFLRRPTIVHIIGQQQTTIDFADILQNQKILLVRLAQEDIGEEGVRLLGTMLIAQLLSSVLARERLPEKEWYYFSLVCDEFQKFASEDFHEMLTRVRKYKVKITIAHQFMKQLDELNRGAVDNTGNKVAFQLTTEDAPYFAPIYTKEPPPGEWIYEKIMRRAGKSYQVEVWDSPEAEDEYNAMEAEINRVQQKLLTEEGKYTKYKDTALRPALPPQLPSQMTPELWKIAEKIMWWFRPYVHDADVLNYLKSLYELVEVPNHFISRDRMQYHFREYYLNFYRNLIPAKRETLGPEKSFKHNYRYAIKRHIQPTTPVQFPPYLRCEFERNDSSALHASLRQEIQEMYAPLRPYACYYFDVKEYEKWSLDGRYCGDLTNFPELFLHPWKGPYFRNDADWLTILNWFHQKAMSLQIITRHIQELTTKQKQLFQQHHRVETQFEWLGWYEPVPVVEWEYLSFAKKLGVEVFVGDNCKYTARQGPSPYTTAEMRNQMETELLRLPNYAAHCQIINLQAESDEKAVVRCKLATNPLDPPVVRTEEAYQSQENSVRMQTRRLYCRPQAEVEAEIIWRRTEWAPIVVQQKAPARSQEEKQQSKQQVKVPPVKTTNEVLPDEKAEEARKQQLIIDADVEETLPTDENIPPPKPKKSRRG